MALTGSICALATPFHSNDDALDLDACARLVDFQLDNGTSAVVVAGSTGEAATLDDGEFSNLLETVVARVAGRVPVLAGSGLSATRKTIAQTRRARDAGVDIALIVTPPYVRATQEGLYRHFIEVAERGGLPIVLYNVPSRTACDMTPETVARLCRHERIVGIKEALPDMARIDALVALKSADFSVLSGDDPSAGDAVRAGAAGVISVAANVAPALMRQWIDGCMNGNQTVQIQTPERRLRPLFEALALESNPIPLKWCLSRLGFGESHLRLPLQELAECYRNTADAALAGMTAVEPAAAVG